MILIAIDIDKQSNSTYIVFQFVTYVKCEIDIHLIYSYFIITMIDIFHFTS